MVLDFEKPIVELESKLEEMKRLARDNQVDVSESVAELEQRITDLKRNIYTKLTRWQRVQLARHPRRPYTLDYIYALTDEFEELAGDRQGHDDKAIVGGIGTMGGQSMVMLGHQKGRDTKSRQYRNFGMANPEGYRKALRLMKLAEKFNKPVVTFIDTPGAYPGMEAEERGQAEAIARNLKEMSKLTVPIIVFVIGEGASGGALGIGVGDRLYMLENTWYSVISPESCSSILWRNWQHKEDAAEALRLTAQDNYELGLIDGIIEEFLEGAHKDPQPSFDHMKQVIQQDLATLQALEPEELVHQRILKFEHMGRVAAQQEGTNAYEGNGQQPPAAHAYAPGASQAGDGTGS
jgi:acetyl-CoA carboxylase carboxyl transferase subunit alpha